MNSKSFLVFVLALMPSAWAQPQTSSEMKRSEWVLNPIVAQLNGQYTFHQGVGATGLFHLHERVGLYVSGQYNNVASETGFASQLSSTFQVTPPLESLRVMPWHAHAGIEVTLLKGAFSFLETQALGMQFFVNGGVGIASTRVRLSRAAGELVDADTGMPWVGALGAGLRLRMLEHFTLRLELRNVFHAAALQTLNGCNEADLEGLNQALRAQVDLKTVPVGAQCQVNAFGTDSVTVAGNLALAQDALKPASEPGTLFEKLFVYAGFSFLF